MRKTSGLWKNNISVMYSIVLVCFTLVFVMFTGFNQTLILDGVIQAVPIPKELKD